MTDEILIARVNQAKLLKVDEPIKKSISRAERIMLLIYQNEQILNNETTKKRKWYKRLFGKI